MCKFIHMERTIRMNDVLYCAMLLLLIHMAYSSILFYTQFTCYALSVSKTSYDTRNDIRSNSDRAYTQHSGKTEMENRLNNNKNGTHTVLRKLLSELCLAATVC